MTSTEIQYIDLNTGKTVAIVVGLAELAEFYHSSNLKDKNIVSVKTVKETTT